MAKARKRTKKQNAQKAKVAKTARLTTVASAGTGGLREWAAVAKGMKSTLRKAQKLSERDFAIRINAR